MTSIEQEAFKIVRQFLQQAKTPKKPPLFIICGPTASGKTALSIELAQRFNGEIISADSRQVYKYMDIGTDKIPLDKREGIPHYLIDAALPSERFTVANFKRRADEQIFDIHRRGKLPMLVGGTGLYIDAVSKNFDLPLENPQVRTKLMTDLKINGLSSLYKKLCELDPVSAQKIHPNNAPYIVRALEIFFATGRQKSDQRKPPHYSCLTFGLRHPKEVLFDRINTRVDWQIRRGLVDEVKSLIAMGFPKELPSMSSLGYREICAYLNGEITLEAATELIKKNTRNYAKRQITWFKRDKGIIWL